MALIPSITLMASSTRGVLRSVSRNADSVYQVCLCGSGHVHTTTCSEQQQGLHVIAVLEHVLCSDGGGVEYAWGHTEGAAEHTHTSVALRATLMPAEMIEMAKPCTVYCKREK